MQTQTAQTVNQERLEVLLAMAIAFNGQKNIEPSENESVTEQILSSLSALPDEDLAAIREKLGYYDALTDEEKRIWQSRLLSRVNSRNLRLDKEVHYTQIAAALRCEPAYICDFILQRLSPEMADEVAEELGRESSANGQHTNVNPDLENLMRRRFLANFVSKEDLFELKPLEMLTGEDVLELVQNLGRSEMAFVCRGVPDVENLAPFLRRFEPEDSQAILEQMTNLRTVERKRLDKAEAMVKEAWAGEKHPTLIIQTVGLTKLASALCESDDLTVRYTLQKIPVVLADKMSEYIKERCENEDNIIYKSEAETAAARILLDKIQTNGAATQPLPKLESEPPAVAGG